MDSLISWDKDHCASEEIESMHISKNISCKPIGYKTIVDTGGIQRGLLTQNKL